MRKDTLPGIQTVALCTHVFISIHAQRTIFILFSSLAAFIILMVIAVTSFIPFELDKYRPLLRRNLRALYSKPFMGLYYSVGLYTIWAPPSETVHSSLL